MKKLILLIAISFSITAVFAQAGINGGTHNVTNESTFSYVVNDGGTDTDTYKWEVFSDANCTSGNEVSSVAGATGTYTFLSGEDSRNVKILWNNAPALAATTTYYLRVSQEGAHSCFTYQTIKIIITNKDDNAGLKFAFVGTEQTQCSVVQSGSVVIVPINLSGISLVHDTGKVVEVKYTVDGVDKGWISVDLIAGPNAGDFTISFPSSSFENSVITNDKDFVIAVLQMKNGLGGTVKDITGATFTVKTWGLPTMSGIDIK